MKVSAIGIFSDYHRIKKTIPHYRLGQHYCNVLGLRDTMFNGLDLFIIENDVLSDKLFYDMCENYNWDVFDLPIFGDYDLSTIKPT